MQVCWESSNWEQSSRGLEQGSAWSGGGVHTEGRGRTPRTSPPPLLLLSFLGSFWPLGSEDKGTWGPFSFLFHLLWPRDVPENERSF